VASSAASPVKGQPKEMKSDPVHAIFI